MGFCYLSAENEVVFLATSSDSVIRSLNQCPLCRGRHPSGETKVVKTHTSLVFTELCPVEAWDNEPAIVGISAVIGKVIGTWRHQLGASQPDWELGEVVGKLLGEEVLFKLVARGWAGINCEGELLLAQGIAYAKVQRGESGQELKKKKKHPGAKREEGKGRGSREEAALPAGGR